MRTEIAAGFSCRTFSTANNLDCNGFRMWEGYYRHIMAKSNAKPVIVGESLDMNKESHRLRFFFDLFVLFLLPVMGN
jgi:hypothetical protein